MSKKYIFIALGIIVLVGFLAPKSVNLKPTTRIVEATKASSQVATLSTESNPASSFEVGHPTVPVEAPAVKADEPAVEAPKVVHINPTPKPVEVTPETNVSSSMLDRWFGKRTGQNHIEQCNSTEAGKHFVEAFAEYGEDKQVIACVTLNNENGTHDLFTRGVCNKKYQEGGDYRRCVYADINSAGLDVGLFQINTFYQAKRISKLGGPSCSFSNSRDWTDPCNKLKAEWLFDIDNQISIIKDIYNEQGFTPWSAYQSKVKPYL